MTELDPGGAEHALVRLATGLNRARWRPTVYCLSECGPLADTLVAAGIPTHCLGAKNWRSVGVIGKLARMLRANRPALLQTFLFHANVAGRIAGWRAGVKPIVAGIRVAEKERRWHRWLDRLTSRFADCHVCVSQGVAEFAEHQIGLPPQRLVVIPNGVDVERFAAATPADLSAYGIAPGASVFLSIGRLEPQMGMPVLLEAF
ncbi:MAG TPA: glycosyltransferase, partial [Planctomycetaceae bacterium]|nr:glycosyltransferase [Planctomycetaceae bacterium]